MLNTKNDEKQYISSCPLGCSAEFLPSGIVLPDGPLLKCSACGQLVFQMTEKEYFAAMEGFNSAQGTYPDDTLSKRYMNRSIKTLTQAKNILSKPFNDIDLLDVGCSSGSFLTAANTLDIKVQGVEPELEPVKTARSFGLQVHHGILEEMNLPEESFDIVTLFEVIEHLKNPILLLTEIKRILRPGGLLIIRTGNTDSWTVSFMKDRWDYFCPQIGHISFFNTHSMKKLAQRCGFTVEKIRFHSVCLHRKEDVPRIVYRTTKIIAELLNFPSRVLGKSHEMEFFLKN